MAKRAKRISLQVYCRGRNGNQNDLTFLVLGQGNVRAATHIHIEYYDAVNKLTYSSEIDDFRGSGLMTYNDTINTNNVTLASVQNVRVPFIDRFQLRAGTELSCRFRILDNGTHIFQINK